MATRTNSKLNATVKPDVVQSQHTAADAAEREAIHATLDQILDEKPKASRFLSFCISFCIGAGIGWLTGVIVNILMAAILIATGSVFLAVCAYVLGYMIAIYSLIYYVPSGDDVIAACGTAKSWLSTKFNAARAKVASAEGPELRSKFGFGAR